MRVKNLCKKCGRCCCEKILLNGEVIYTPVMCEFLDSETRLCTIYDRRKELQPDCTSVQKGITMGLLPPDCPFVKDLPNYRPPRLTATKQETALLRTLENEAEDEL